jgi:hypothetical protein
METDLFPSNSSANDVYELVKWPEVQELMEYDWFRNECFLCNASDSQEQLSSAYFVPIRRLMEIDEEGQSQSLI